MRAPDIANEELMEFATIADRLHIDGKDRERSVRRLFARYKVKFIKRGRGGYLASEDQFKALIEAMTICSPSEDAARNSTSVVRSVSGARRASSKSILQDAIAETMRRPTDPSSSPTSGMKSFTVVEGGRRPNNRVRGPALYGPAGRAAVIRSLAP
jgi:hypothetical protein